MENFSACCNTSRGIKLAASQADRLRSACSLAMTTLYINENGLEAQVHACSYSDTCILKKPKKLKSLQKGYLAAGESLRL